MGFLMRTTHTHISWRGLTLIELLMVISVVGLMIGILLPILSRAREYSQRVVCLSNLRQLTLGWQLYAQDHDGDLVSGKAFEDTRNNRGRIWKTWLGRAFRYPDSRSALMADSDKGALWPYLKDIDVYRCRRTISEYGSFLGRTEHYSTYVILPSANGPTIDGTHVPGENYGTRVGKTVLRLTNFKDIEFPGPSERSVFMDYGGTFGNIIIEYLSPEYSHRLPKHHAKGTTFSFADGHAEYWKWKAQETLAPKLNKPLSGGNNSVFRPETDKGLHDLQRVQKAMWGRIGYSTEE
jgi:prepilin-type N-terminal cleavage/methylation domain-containing protein/prepilin-type processing-associated H-X9-DG protein